MGSRELRLDETTLLWQGFMGEARDFNLILLSAACLCSCVLLLTMDGSDNLHPQMIKLKSAEGHEFFVDRRCAMVSGTIKSMLAGQFAESRGEISFPEIPSIIMEKLIQYLYYKVRYTNASYRIPEFQVDPEIALELLIASGYLDC